MSPSRVTRSNAFPEGANWADTGCILYPTCLSCPMRQCVYEERGGIQALLNREKRNRIILLKQRGVSVRNISHDLAISIRSVYRALEQLTPPP